MRAALRRLSAWYQRHYLATLVVTTGAFLLQLFHLYWLFADVILTRLTGRSYFAFPPAGMVVYVLADYIEIPTLVSASLLYLFELWRGRRPRALIYLILLNTQWLHILWLTDEVVVASLTSTSLISWNAALAWLAILIDYLEVPVIIDTLRRVVAARHEILDRLAARSGAVASRRARAAPGHGAPAARPAARRSSRRRPSTTSRRSMP